MALEVVFQVISSGSGMLDRVNSGNIAGSNLGLEVVIPEVVVVKEASCFLFRSKSRYSNVPAVPSSP